MPTAKNGFHILNPHPKKYLFQKRKYIFYANLLEKFLNFIRVHITTK